MPSPIQNEDLLQKRTKVDAGYLLPPLPKIPGHVFNHPDLFNGVLPNEFLSYMAEVEANLLEKIKKTFAFDRSAGEGAEDIEEYDVHYKRNLWLAIAISHPQMSQINLGEIAWYLKIPPQDLFYATILWGSVPHAMHQIQQYKQGSLQTLPEEMLFHILVVAAEYGHYDLLTYCHKELRPGSFRNIMQKNAEGHVPYNAYHIAVARGHLLFAQALETFMPELVGEMRTSSEDRPFQWAVGHWQVDVIKHLTATLSKEQIQARIRSYNFRAYTFAVDNNCLEGVRYLEEHADPKDLENMVGCANHYPLKKAIFHKNRTMVEHLLSYLSVFSYAEGEASDYDGLDGYLNPLVTQKLIDLRSLEEKSSEDEPSNRKKSRVMQGKAADTNDAHTQYLYLILHNLIRRDMDSLQQDITFLLEMPPLRALAHQHNNRLLALAKKLENRFVIDSLMRLPSVQQLEAVTTRKRSQRDDAFLSDSSRLSKLPSRFLAQPKPAASRKRTSETTILSENQNHAPKQTSQTPFPAHMLLDKNFFPEKTVPEEFYPFMRETDESELLIQLKEFAFLLENHNAIRKIRRGGRIPENFNMPENVMSSQNMRLLDTFSMKNGNYYKASLCISVAISHPILPLELLQKIIKGFNVPQEYFFYAAILWGNLKLLNALIEKYKREGTLVSIVEANHHEAMIIAATNNRSELLLHLEQEVGGLSQGIFSNYNVLLTAIENGHANIVSKYFEKLRTEDRKAFFARSYTHCIEKNCVTGMRTLDSVTKPKLLRAWIADNNHEFFKSAWRKKSRPIIEHLLGHSCVLSYAEMNAPLYDAYLFPLITQKMEDLHLQAPSADINVPDSENLYFMAHHLIRRNDKPSHDALSFLLGFPSVQAIANKNDNALIRMAMLIKNIHAVRLLASIPAVKQTAADQNLEADAWISAQSTSTGSNNARNRFVGKPANSESDRLANVLVKLLPSDFSRNSYKNEAYF